MTAVGETCQPARPIRMLLTKHNIPILNGDYILPKIQDSNIRKSLARMKSEILGMDVRIGVIRHTLLQAELKNRQTLKRDISQVVNKEKSKGFETMI